MRVGVNVSPAEVTPTVTTLLPGAATCRVFAPAGKGIPTWTSPTVTALRAAGVTPWVSFKDWTTDTTAKAAINTWLAGMPTTGRALLTYHHEPEGDLSSKDYRRRWVTLARTVRAHPNAARVTLVPIHTLYPARHKSGDAYTTDWTQWVGVWQQWAPFDGRTYCGDLMGWDCYQEIANTRYEDPDTFFRIPVSAAYHVGVPLAIPELGAVRVPGDTGTGRAEWITACVDHLATAGAAHVNWWHSTGTNNADYRLSDTASQRAWLDAITVHNRTA